MTTYEYKVVPAPTRGRKGRGVSGSEARFAFAIETMMNDMAADGWEYVRADTLPQEERQGLTGTQVTYRTLLVFRKPRETAADAFRPRLLDPPSTAPRALPAAAPDATDQSEDNGVESPRPVDALPPTLAARAARFFAAKGATQSDDDIDDDDGDDTDTPKLVTRAPAEPERTAPEAANDPKNDAEAEAPARGRSLSAK